MKTSIDIKSVLLGSFVGIAAMFVIGAGGTSSNGRYQVVTGNSANGSGVAIMVDTQTGKAWGADIQKDWQSGGFWDAKP